MVNSCASAKMGPPHREKEGAWAGALHDDQDGPQDGEQDSVNVFTGLDHYTFSRPNVQMENKTAKIRVKGDE